MEGRKEAERYNTCTYAGKEKNRRKRKKEERERECVCMCVRVFRTLSAVIHDETFVKF